MAKRPKSEALTALHETMQDLHSVGGIDDRRMREYDDACLDSEEQSASTPLFSLVGDVNSGWRWLLRSATGEVIAEAGRSYPSKKAALEAIDEVRKAAHAEIAH